MPLFVRDREVDRLVARLAELSKMSKTDIVRRALQSELERIEAAPSLVEKGLAFARALEARSGPGLPADKAFIDGLYED